MIKNGFTSFPKQIPNIRVNRIKNQPIDKIIPKKMADASEASALKV